MNRLSFSTISHFRYINVEELCPCHEPLVAQVAQNCRSNTIGRVEYNSIER